MNFYRNRKRVSALFDFGDWEITLREVIFSIFIIGIMMVLGFFISGKIEKRALDNILKYRQAVHISTTNEFIHAINTDVGYAFVEGKLEACKPVEVDHLNGRWLSVLATKEHYTMHVQIYTTSDGKHVRVHTRTYWTWDEVNSRKYHSDNVVFCGSTFPFEAFDYVGANVQTHVHMLGSHDRIVFHSIPNEFNATLFENISKTNAFKNAKLYCNRKIQDVYDDLTTSYSVMIFWIIWAFFTFIVIIGFYVIDNDWLEDD